MILFPSHERARNQQKRADLAPDQVSILKTFHKSERNKWRSLQDVNLIFDSIGHFACYLRSASSSKATQSCSPELFANE